MRGIWATAGDSAVSSASGRNDEHSSRSCPLSIRSACSSEIVIALPRILHFQWRPGSVIVVHSASIPSVSVRVN